VGVALKVEGDIEGSVHGLFVPNDFIWAFTPEVAVEVA
jgi:hypothetical protein